MKFKNSLCPLLTGFLMRAGLSPVMAATRTYQLVGMTTAGGATVTGGFTYDDVLYRADTDTIDITIEADPVNGLPADTITGWGGFRRNGTDHTLVVAGTISSMVFQFDAFVGTQPEYIFDENSPGFIYIFVNSTEGIFFVNRKVVEVLPVTDTDGDGVPDDEDAFPNDPTESADSDEDGVGNNSNSCVYSDLCPTVVIDGIDTGVTNDLLDGGCTISDLIDIAELVSSNHGQFVSAVAHLMNRLKDEGVITGKEKGAIQKVAAKAFK